MPEIVPPPLKQIADLVEEAVHAVEAKKNDETLRQLQLMKAFHLLSIQLDELGKRLESR